MTTKESLLRQAPRGLEEWAMMMIEPAEASQKLFSATEPFLVATMAFRCDEAPDGVVYAIAQRGFCNTLYGNVLGSNDESEVNDEQRSDAIRELLNIVTGHFVSDFYTHDAVVELLAPQCHATTITEVEQLISPDAVCFIADDFPVMFVAKNAEKA